MSYEEKPFKKLRFARLFDAVDHMAGRGPGQAAPDPRFGSPGGKDPNPEEMEARRAAAEIPHRKPPSTQ